MFVSKNLSVNEKGHLTIAGADAVSLAEKYGTPLYVMDEDNKNMQLSSKQLREVKGNDITPQQSIRYELVKMMLDNILMIDDEDMTFGNSVIINTMLSEGLITEVKEN